WSELMGQPAPFPQGPFILASLLPCPVVVIFALCQQGKLTLHCDPFADPLLLPPAHPQHPLPQTVDP
ncbi:glycosyltransferase family 2 protein, partial [Enterobacter intestinihominis]